MRLSGGCHCGAIRFGGEAEILWAGHCHCRDCQLTSGAPLVSWATVHKAAIAIDGKPADYRSSAKGLRQFCPRCGAQLFWFGTRQPDRMDIALACLDEPDTVSPTVNIFIRSRLRLMRGFDGALPSHAADPPDG